MSAPPSPPAPPPPERSGSRAWRGAVAALVAADIAFAYQQTAVLPVIPDIERALHVAGAWGAWLLSGYLLVATVSTPLIGRLADLYGRRRLLLVGLAVFLAGSVGAASSPHFAVLVTFRALQGVGGAVFPLSLSIVRQELPRHRVGAATGLLTGAFGMGTALGFATSGALAQLLSWRLVFAVGAVVVAVAVPLVVRRVPARPAPSSGALDLRGALWLGAGLGALLVALTVGPQSRGAGWLLPAGLLAAAGLAGAGWLRREHRAEAPLVALSLLRAPTELWTNAVTLVIGYALFGTYYLLPQFVQDPRHGLGSGTALIGLYLLPSAVGQLVCGPAADRLRFGGSPRGPLGWGMAAMGLGAAGFAAVSGLGRSVPAAASVTGLLVASFVLGCGTGLAIGASSTLVALGAGAEHASVATSLNSTVRRVGGGVGSQISAGVLLLGGRGGGSWVLAFAVTAGLCAVAGAAGLRMPVRREGRRVASAGKETSVEKEAGDRSW